MVSSEVRLRGILGGLNDIDMLPGVPTRMLAVAVPPVPPFVDVMFPVVLACMPGAEPMTLIEKVQLVLAASDAPTRRTTDVLGTAVTVPPPQEPVSPLG